MVVLFDFIAGSEPKAGDLHVTFRHLGSIAARMHRHARSWKRPAWFERQRWDYEGAFGPAPNWGHWRDGFAHVKGGFDIIDKADRLMQERLSRFGKAASRFGLIHSDLHDVPASRADGLGRVASRYRSGARDG